MWRKCPNSAFSPFLSPRECKIAPVMNIFHAIYLYDIVFIVRIVFYRAGHRKCHKQGANINNYHFDTFWDPFMPPE